ncbi:MAG: esterase [Rhodospirillales bacterium]|nr:esterase [Rhodospirillales bacterium]
MDRRLHEAYQETMRYVVMALKALMFWRRSPPIDTVDGLIQFVETRSKFVAQTTLYGYIRTRVGTRFISFMEDDVFASSVDLAKWEIYLACLSDLAIYATAVLGRNAGAHADATAHDSDELRDIAIRIMESALANEPSPADRPPADRPNGFDDSRRAFGERARSTAWGDMANGEEAFSGSLAALVEWAPVADELKIHDVEIVRFSIRFRWKTVRDQLKDTLDADAVLTDWRA